MDLNPTKRSTFSFGDFRVDSVERVLMRNGELLWWHDLRATFGTRLGEAGHGLATIMDLMGHRDPQTCLRYVRATEPAKRAAVAAASVQRGHKMDTRRLVAV